MRLYTIGHSNQSFEEFVRLLSEHGVSTIVDVRSRPYSRFKWFSRRELKAELAFAEIKYLWLGDGFGGLETIEPETRERAEKKLAALLAAGEEVALMCSEEDPNRCHRLGLSEELLASGMVSEVVHIRRSGRWQEKRQDPQRGLFDNKTESKEPSRKTEPTTAREATTRRTSLRVSERPPSSPGSRPSPVQSATGPDFEFDERLADPPRKPIECPRCGSTILPDRKRQRDRATRRPGDVVWRVLEGRYWCSSCQHLWWHELLAVPIDNHERGSSNSRIPGSQLGDAGASPAPRTKDAPERRGDTEELGPPLKLADQA